MKKRNTLFWLVLILTWTLMAFSSCSDVDVKEPDPEPVSLYSISQTVSYHKYETKRYFNEWNYSITRDTIQEHILLTTILKEKDTTYKYHITYKNLKTWYDIITIETARDIKCMRYMTAQRLLDDIEYINGIDCDEGYITGHGIVSGVNTVDSLIYSY